MTTYAAAAALAALAALSALTGRISQTPVPPPDSIRLAHEDAVQAVALMSLGMRRLAADLAFIRLLMYYGSSQVIEGEDGDCGKAPEGPTLHAHAHEGQAHVLSAAGVPGRNREYPQLGERAIRILDLDPFFDYAVQYAAGALAFNLQRPDDALSVLRHAVARDPKNWRYHSYVAAVGFHKQGDPAKARDQLAPIANEPEAPTMLKHILAFLDLRLGYREEAIRLYRDILKSRDANYHPMARAALRRLGIPEEP